MKNFIKEFVNNWYNISVYIAVAILLIVVFFIDDPLQKVLLCSAAVLFLHFFEEFGWPWGFPYMWMKVMMNSKETDSTKWNCNNLNSMYWNWLSAILIYILPAFFSDVNFLVLGAMVLSCEELIMHLILFNIKEKTLYNPWLVSGLFGLVPIACYFFINIFDASNYVWYDYVGAVVWFGVIFWACFRSPWYWKIGWIKWYPLTDQSAYGYDKPKK